MGISLLFDYFVFIYGVVVIRQTDEFGQASGLFLSI